VTPLVCGAARPTNGERSLALVQTWKAPSGQSGELILEPHSEHVHVWIRWAQDFDIPMDGPDDWAHFIGSVWPVARDVVDAFRCCVPLDVGFLDLIAEAAQP
jgi:hypothetical protein